VTYLYCTVVTLGAGTTNVATINGMNGNTLTATLVSGGSSTSQSFTYMVDIGIFDITWNTTLSKVTTYTAYGDSSSVITSPGIPEYGTGTATHISVASVNDTGCFTGYSSWPTSGADSVTILSGVITLVFF